MTDDTAAGCLLEAVEAQAGAFVAGDIAGFASYALPEALSSVYRSRVPGTIRSYEILSIDAADGQGRSEVRFRGARDFVLRASWVHTAEGWRAATLEMPDGAAREGFLRRALRFGRPAPQVAQREDLS